MTDIEMNEDLEVTPSELETLQQRLTQMGVKFHHKSSVEKLRALLAKTLSGDAEEEASEAEALSEAQRRVKAREEAMALVRVNVHCKDPNKKDWEGDIFTVSNAVVGTVKKYIKYDTENGYHLPKIMVDMLRDKQLQLFRSVKQPNGMTTRESYLTTAYTIEVLPPLTPEELAALSADQRARNAIDQ